MNLEARILSFGGANAIQQSYAIQTALVKVGKQWHCCSHRPGTCGSSSPCWTCRPPLIQLIIRSFWASFSNASPSLILPDQPCSVAIYELLHFTYIKGGCPTAVWGGNCPPLVAGTAAVCCCVLQAQKEEVVSETPTCTWPLSLWFWLTVDVDHGCTLWYLWLLNWLWRSVPPRVTMTKLKWLICIS